MEVLKVENLSKHFGGVRAVDDVTFKVESGERIFIIGPNGAGKTTLLNLLNGQLSATKGNIYFFGQVLTHMPTHKRAHLGQARSYQISNLFPRLTTFESVRLAIQGNRKFRYQMFRPITAYSELPDKVDELLERGGLLGRRDEEVRNLSHGEQRRLEIALSLASAPKLLLLDEPTAGLTTGESQEVVQVIHGLSKDITVMVVAHDMDLVFGVAERIIVLHLGRYLCDGTCEEIRTNPMVREIYLSSEEVN